VEASAPTTTTAAQPALQGFLQLVFAWMFAGLTVTAIAAGLIGASDSLLTDITSSPGIFIGVVVAQLALVFALSVAIDRISVAVATLMFFLYAALNGVIFALVFELYTAQSIFTTFLIAAGMFGILAVIGGTTDRDLSKLGTILYVALFGLIVASVVNLFVASSGLYWITTYAGVIIFSGLIAYDMQKLKQMAQAGVGEGEAADRQAILGALALYLDFINLFLYLLRIFGKRR